MGKTRIDGVFGKNSKEEPIKFHYAEWFAIASFLTYGIDAHVIGWLYTPCPHCDDMNTLDLFSQRSNPASGETQDGIVRVRDQVKE